MGPRISPWLGLLALAGCSRPELDAPRRPEVAPKPAAIDTKPALAPLPADDPEPAAIAPLALLPIDDMALEQALLRELGGARPRSWGEAVAGVHTRLDTRERVVALTFDACGGPGGNGYDAELIALLQRERVPATLLLSARWIEAHPDEAFMLAHDPLFEIENHGKNHRPCSLSGRGAFGLRGTRNVSEAIDEIRGGAQAVRALTGKAPHYYRAGTAHYDELCAHAAVELGQTPIGYTVNGDAGRGFSAPRVREALLGAPAGAVVLMHMNRPRGGTAEGVAAALPELSANGVRFVRLTDVATR